MLVAVCAWFAATVPARSPVALSDLSPPDTRAGTAPEQPRLNVTAFEQARIWVESPVVVDATPMPERTEPPPPPVTLELLAIVVKPDPGAGKPTRFAAIYDPEQDRVFIVRSGERVGKHEIIDVEPTRIVLMTDSRRTILGLSSTIASHGSDES